MKLHCIPVADEKAHDTTGITCWCEPRVEWLDPETGLPWVSGHGPLVHHNAADCREYGEIDGESVEPGKGWEVLEVD